MKVIINPAHVLFIVDFTLILSSDAQSFALTISGITCHMGDNYAIQTE